MSIISSVREALFGKVSGIGISTGEFLANVLLAAILFVLGIFIGKLVKFGLRKLVEKTNIKKIMKASFVDLILVVIKWSIYILFINLALIQLGIPMLTDWLVSILSIIPSLTGALIVISVGFAIGTYLKKVISESKVDGWRMLSQIFFYFIIYVFIILAFKTALISLQDQLLVNILIITFTALGGVALLVNYFKGKEL